MKTPLAWLQLTHQRTRTAVAVAGVAFAIILIFMQLGFYGAVEATATLFYDKLDFDLLLVSPRYVNLNQASAFPRRQMYQARDVPEVENVLPVYVGFQFWLSPEPNPANRSRRQVLVIGVRPDDPVFSVPALERHLAALRKPNTVLTDTLSRDILGPRGPGVVTELGSTQVEVVAEVTLGTGFGADGLVLVSAETFARVCSRPLSMVSLGLIQLRPGTDPRVVTDRLRQLLPSDVQVFPRAEVVAREKHYWVSTTSVGLMFQFGVAVALIAGMVFIYQVISSDVRKHYAEYATLKAIGYRKSFLSGVIMQQALFLAVLGYVPALLVSLALYDLTRRAAVIPIWMNAGRIILVLVLALGTCSISGLLCLRKVHSADPADLF